MTTPIQATLIPGDGIGPEIVDATLAALDALGAPFEWDRQIAGLGAGWHRVETLHADAHWKTGSRRRTGFPAAP